MKANLFQILTRTKMAANIWQIFSKELLWRNKYTLRGRKSVRYTQKNRLKKKPKTRKYRPKRMKQGERTERRVGGVGG